MHWILFLPQLPSTPSSLRVTVWRKMRSAGALGLQNGVWILPDRPEQRLFVNELVAVLQNQGANGLIFTIVALDSANEEEINNRLRADREEEYVELIERSADLLAEINRETEREKFTFAELEEIEQDMQKLEKWYEKIRQRDLLGAANFQTASEWIAQCQASLAEFSGKVYARQGLDAENNQAT